MKMKKIVLACGAAMLGVTGVAGAEVSMNIGATSNYIWRGVTQTHDAAAVSGGIDWSGASGFYAGAWASNADWADNMSYELDLYGGFAGEVGDFGYDLGVIFYTYDEEAETDFAELALSGSWNFLSAGVNYTFSGDDDAVEGDTYIHAGVSFDLPENFAIGATLGNYDFDAEGADDYTHYQLDLSRSAGDFGDVTLSLSDTDVDGDDMKVFVSWGKSF